MARPQLTSPHQPPAIRLLLGLYQTAASLRLAVAVIFGSAAVLGYATFVESWYGTEAVQFGVYGTWWFAAILALLGLNVLCAALIRFPWKRYQTGFVITHAGIIILLFGCLLSWLGSIDAQMPVLEGGTGHVAYEDTQHFALEIRPETGKGVKIAVPFAAGPFNWADYAGRVLPGGQSSSDERGKSALTRFPWSLARRDRGMLYDRDGVRLEVLDYYADSERAPAKSLTLRVKGSAAANSKGNEKIAGDWQTVSLGIEGTAGAAHSGMGVGARKELAGGERIVFWPARNQAETDAFLASRPEGPLGEKGQLVLFARGERVVLKLDEVKAGAPLPLGKSGLEIELERLDERFLGAVLWVSAPDKDDRQRLLLLADFPEFNQQDAEHGVYGTYWFDAAKRASGDDAETQADAQAGHHPERPRLDILQGADGKLYYRAWKSPTLAGIAELPPGGGQVTAFEQQPLTLAVERFAPEAKSGFTVVPLPFVKAKDKGMKERRAQVRLTVDGRSETFWLAGLPATPFTGPANPEQRRTIEGEDRRVTISLPWDQVDVGFRLHLHKFERKLDPGTSQASHYSSVVSRLPLGDVDADEHAKLLDDKIVITLNDPVNFADPRTGKSYRIYQEAFRGPWRPGDPDFEGVLAMTGREDLPDEVFLSWLTVNYDPGRGLKYFGCLMIVAGIATMFYMRAYFFRPRGDQVNKSPTAVRGGRALPSEAEPAMRGA